MRIEIQSLVGRERKVLLEDIQQLPYTQVYQVYLNLIQLYKSITLELLASTMCFNLSCDYLKIIKTKFQITHWTNKMIYEPTLAKLVLLNDYFYTGFSVISDF